MKAKQILTSGSKQFSSSRITQDKKWRRQGNKQLKRKLQGQKAMSCNREPSNLSPFGSGLEIVAQLEALLNTAGWTLQKATPTYTRNSSTPLSISYRLDVTRPDGKRDQVLIPESTATGTLSDYINKS